MKNTRITIVESIIEQDEDMFLDGLQLNEVQVQSITHLDLVSCQIKKLPKWKLMDKVLFLNLSLNHITNLDFPLPPNLIYLSLSYNQIAEVPDQLKSLASLRIVSLKGNPIASQRFYRRKVLLNLKQLQVLDDISRNNTDICDPHEKTDDEAFREKTGFQPSIIIEFDDEGSYDDDDESHTKEKKLTYTVTDKKKIKKLQIEDASTIQEQASTILKQNSDIGKKSVCEFGSISPIQKKSLKSSQNDSFDKFLKGTSYDFSSKPMKQRR